MVHDRDIRLWEYVHAMVTFIVDDDSSFVFCFLILSILVFFLLLFLFIYLF